MPLQYDKAPVNGIAYGGDRIVGSSQPSGVEAADTLVSIASSFGEVANKQSQQEQRAKGQAAMMDAAIQGKQKEVLQDAATDENKWYNKIFGPSAFYKGMQDMAAEAQAGQFHATELEKMYKAQGDGGTGHINPDTYRQYLVEQISSKKTGDPLVDAKIMSSMLPVAQTLGMKQAEKYAEYANVTAATNYVAAVTQAKGAFEQEAQGRQVDQNARNAVLAQPSAQLAQVFVNKPDGMQTDTFTKVNSEMVLQDIKDGNVVLYNMWKNSGWLAKSAPEQQLKIAEGMKDYENSRSIEKAIPLFANMIKIQNAAENADVNGVLSGFMDQRKLEDSIGMKTPGVPNLTAAITAKLHDTVQTRYAEDRANQREARAAARAAAAEARAALKLQAEIGAKVTAATQTAIGMLGGNTVTPIRDDKTGMLRLPSDSDKESAYLMLRDVKNRQAQSTTGQAMTLADKFNLSNTAGVKDPDIQNTVHQLTLLNGQQLSQDARQQIIPQLDQLVQATKGDMSRLDTYGADKLTKYNLDMYSDLRRKNLTPEQAYARSFAVVGTAEATVDKKTLKAAIEDQVGHWWNQGSLYQVKDSVISLTPRIEKEAEYLSRQKPGLNADQLVKVVADRIRKDGVDTVGGKPIIRNAPSAGMLYQQAGLSNIPQADAAVIHMHDTLSKSLSSRGVKVTDFLVDQNYTGSYVYTPVSDGLPLFSESVELSPAVMKSNFLGYLQDRDKHVVPTSGITRGGGINGANSRLTK